MLRGAKRAKYKRGGKRKAYTTVAYTHFPHFPGPLALYFTPAGLPPGCQCCCFLRAVRSDGSALSAPRPPCRTDEGAALPVILICPHDAQPLAQRRGYTVGYLVFARVLVNRSQYANFGVTMPCDDHVRKAATPQCFTSDSAAVKSRTCPPVPYFGDCASLISAKPNSQNS